jgi:hypothetical protein
MSWRGRREIARLGHSPLIATLGKDVKINDEAV